MPMYPIGIADAIINLSDKHTDSNVYYIAAIWDLLKVSLCVIIGGRDRVPAFYPKRRANSEEVDPKIRR